jgi:predicted ArsR family transcriptional regulator
MTKDEILETLKNNLDHFGKTALYILSRESIPVGKESLGEMINERWRSLRQKAKDEGKLPQEEKIEDLVKSRYSLDIGMARLEGAGLVHIKQHGMARLYSLSPLGLVMCEYLQSKNSKGSA